MVHLHTSPQRHNDFASLSLGTVLCCTFSSFSQTFSKRLKMQLIRSVSHACSAFNRYAKCAILRGLIFAYNNTLLVRSISVFELQVTELIKL